MLSRELLAHLQKEHQISPLSVYLKEIVYGGNDGIVTTFAVVAGFAGAQVTSGLPSIPFFTVLLFGIANLLADGASMGLGNFLSLRSEQDVYKTEKARELHEIRHNPQAEMEETLDILTHKGFSRGDALTIATTYSKNEKYWVEFMMKDELELPNPEKENPFITALTTFGSFVTFGIIPLIPYIFFRGSGHLFLMSIVFTLLALLLLGIIRWRVTKVKMLRSIGEIVFIGSVAATLAYTVGLFFRL